MLKRVGNRLRCRRPGVVRLLGRGMNGSLFVKLLTLLLKLVFLVFGGKRLLILLVLLLLLKTILFGVKSILVRLE